MTVIATKTVNVTTTTTRTISLWLNESGKYCFGYIHPSGTRVVYDSGSKGRITKVFKGY